MIKIPLFIHINSSGGRYIRNKLCENYNDNFIVHHINPRLYLDIVPRDKVVRCWKYRNPKINYNTKLKKYYNVSIFDLNDTIPFIILRNPVERYNSENKNITAPWKNIKSYNIMCKSIYVAFTGIYNDFFEEFNEEKYNRLIKFMNKVIVIPLNKIENLSNSFEFNSPLIYKSLHSKNNNKIIEDINYFDCKLYNLYK